MNLALYFIRWLSPNASFYYNEGNCNDSAMMFLSSAHDNSQMFIKNIKFVNILEFYVKLDLFGVARFENCTFSGGVITTGIILPSQSQASVINCTFENLSVYTLISSTDVQNLTISNSIFRNLTLRDKNQTGTIRLMKKEQNMSSIHMIEDCSFSNISVLTTLIFLNSSGVELNMVNVSMKNVVLQKYNVITFSYQIYLDLLKWPGGVCCLAHKKAILKIESSSFVNIGSHCLGLRDSQLSLISTTFDNSQLENENSAVNIEMISELDENSGATWVNLQGTLGDENQIVVIGNRFVQNTRIPLYGGVVFC